MVRLREQPGVAIATIIKAAAVVVRRVIGVLGKREKELPAL
jgi:hypothetical protein